MILPTIVTLALLFIGKFFLFPKLALAHCPLCTAGAGVGLTLSRLLGIDDSITGIWVGGFLGSVSFWTYGSLPRKFRFPFSKELLFIVIFGTTLWSFYTFNLINTHSGQIVGVDKLTLGVIVGSLVFYITDRINGFVINRHKGVFIPFQRLIVSLLSMLTAGFVMYILINYYI